MGKWCPWAMHSVQKGKSRSSRSRSLDRWLANPNQALSLGMLLAGANLLATPTAWSSSSTTTAAEAPVTYSVEKGDTLWGIANRFFKDPQQWLDLWDRNPFISNPDLIYPGDRLHLEGVAEKHQPPRQRVEHLSPKPHTAKVQRLKATPAVDQTFLHSFSNRYSLLSSSLPPEDLASHLVAGGKNRTLLAPADRVYAHTQRRTPRSGKWYTFRDPQPIVHPETGKRLGYLLEHTAVVQLGAPHKGIRSGRIVKVFAAPRPGDHLYPAPASPYNTHSEQHPDPKKMEGILLQSVDDQEMMGQGDVVILNLGRQDGLKQGHVLIVQGEPRTVVNPRIGTRTRLPRRQKGVVRVIQNGGELSFALVTENTRSLERGDRVVSPRS